VVVANDNDEGRRTIYLLAGISEEKSAFPEKNSLLRFLLPLIFFDCNDGDDDDDDDDAGLHHDAGLTSMIL
jgi:hypothetical protein